MPDFGMGNLVLDNTIWWNPKTGDSFKVRSNYMEDNDMIIQAVDGRVFKMSQLANKYLQWHGEGQPPKTPVESTNPSSNHTDLPPEIAAEIETDADNSEESLIDPEDLAMINGAGAPAAPKVQLPKAAPNKPVSDDVAIIERALKKAKKPSWNIVMKWPNFPQDEIKLLHAVMGIPIDDIADYYLNNIISEFDSFVGNLKSQLSDYILDKITPQDEEAKSPAKPKVTKPKTKKQL